jgi:hypothetical protein
MIFDNIISGIQELISNDNEDPQKQSDNLESLYQLATSTQKKAIDNAFICICGYTLDTIINNPENISLEASNS